MQKQKSLRVVAVSDTHSSFSQHESIIQSGIKGDLFIQAGDFTSYGKEQHFKKFLYYLERLNFRYKIVIAGNHQIPLDGNLTGPALNKYKQKYPNSISRQYMVDQLKKRSIYLQHEFIQIQGIKIFGSPFTPMYSKGAFQYPKQQDMEIWNTLPSKIDLLITHGPPLGILDLNQTRNINGGSKGLRKRVFQIKPKFHIFRHIHDGHGKRDVQGTTFLNVAKKFVTFVIS